MTTGAAPVGSDLGVVRWEPGRAQLTWGSAGSMGYSPFSRVGYKRARQESYRMAKGYDLQGGQTWQGV